MKKTTLLTEPADVGCWEGNFITNCAACHRADAGGQGPNLTDDQWILNLV
jgi:cytochrome c oxidase cbb3-type subunit 3